MGRFINTLKNVFNSAILFKKQSGLLPQTLNFFVTSRCNARCEFCLYSHSVESPTAKEKELTLAEIEKIADNYGNLHYLAISGGEPFLRSDLAEICEAFIQRCAVKVVDIPSNFSFTEAMVKCLSRLTQKYPDVFFDLQMSLDGVGEKHDRSRKVKGLYERAKESFKAVSAIREKSPNLRIKGSFLYLESNRVELGEILSTSIKNFDFDRISLSYPQKLLPAGLGIEPDIVRDVQEYTRSAKAILEACETRRNRFDLHVAGMLAVKRIYRGMLERAVLGVRNVGDYCRAGRNILIINQEGDVFPCEPLWHRIGNLRETGGDVKAILNGREYEVFRNKYLGFGKCNCTWSCAIHSAIAVNARNLPLIAVYAMNHLGRGLLKSA